MFEPFPILFPQSIAFTSIENEVTAAANISLRVLRLDEIHPLLSGNKLFKLYYYLQEAIQENLPIVTFGGAYSNHLLATAFACRELNIKCTGIVRGEEPASYSATLLDCIALGMELKFVGRQEYRQMTSISITHKSRSKRQGILVPEGGYDKAGVLGAAHIMDVPGMIEATHVVVATGTATTLAGIISKGGKNQEVIAVPVIKNMTDISERLQYLLGSKHKSCALFDGYHFGGYAKHNEEQLTFINQLWQQQQIPTDIVYTSKMLFALLDKIAKKYFAPGSKIVAIHTGGLQGNRSLPTGTLLF